MPLEIIRADLTQVHVDVIVNAANSTLQAGGGVCGAIFAAAGVERLQKECNAIGGCKVGEAVMTRGYDLPARFIIHAVGPVWHGGKHDEEKILANCYRNALSLAKTNKLKSIAFPLISSGIYHFPKDKALTIAISAISDFLLENDMTVYLVVFDKTAFVLSKKLFSSVKQYIDDHYIDEHNFDHRRQEAVYEPALFSVDMTLQEMQAPMAVEKSRRNLRDLVDRLDESFSQMLLRLIDEKGETDVETYKRANIDRKLFSKIRSDKFYTVSKPTAIALAIALELNLDETRDLLGKAGFALSHSSKFDVIVEYFIEEGNYNIFEINEALFAFDQVLLGASMSLVMRPE